MSNHHDTLQNTLNALDPEQTYLPLLQTLAVVGVADKQQLARATHRSRDQLFRLFKKLAALEPPLFVALDQTLPRAGTRGRAPTVYRLTEAGAALLRANGQPHARPCALHDPLAITHALALLDLYLVARQHDRKIVVDQPLSFSQARVIRPDAIITLTDGTRALFELEQAATPALLRRLCESVRHKAAFFDHTPQGYTSTVRLLVALPRGASFDKTLALWQQALHIVQTQTQRPLPFRLWALPLGEFVAQPDWNEPPDPTRWRELQPQRPTASAARTAPPLALTQHSPRDDALILKSLWLFLREQAPNLGHPTSPDPAFFEVMRVIYVASHDPTLSVWTQAQFPYASLFLLQQYLAMHPRLKERLVQLFKRGAWAGRASVPILLHRMQVVIDAFLEYHGWRSYGPLQARASLVAFDAEEPQGFGVTVHLAPTLPLEVAEMDTLGDVLLTERALAWVLWALFNYAPHLGLDVPTFW